MSQRVAVRQSGNAQDQQGLNGLQLGVIIAMVSLSILLSALVFSYVILRRMRADNRTPKFLPGAYLKKKWEQWQPLGKYASVHSAERAESLRRTETRYNGTPEERAAQNAAAAGIDRNTSVRSVMTLPAYSQTPKETEQVLGREGERAGMDTVVEFPETQEEEESARDNEMESLYQIRVARRREIAEREERRRLRREARERGDWARLEELRRESRQRADDSSTTNLTAEMLIAEHQSRPRDRRVSSVAYAAVGQVRHDGTRVRANSVESERGALLDGAAPMGENSRNNSEANSIYATSNLSRPNLPFANRHRSNSGVSSVSSAASSFDTNRATPMTTNTDEPMPRPSDVSERPTTSSNSIPPEMPRITPQNTNQRSDEVDARIVSMIQDSDNDILPPQPIYNSRPPEYETHDWGNAPAYEERERMRRAESLRLQQQEAQNRAQSQNPLMVPSINVQLASEPNTPVLGRDSVEETRR